jgi:hypothetical protein
MNDSVNRNLAEADAGRQGRQQQDGTRRSPCWSSIGKAPDLRQVRGPVEEVSRSRRRRTRTTKAISSRSRKLPQSRRPRPGPWSSLSKQRRSCNSVALVVEGNIDGDAFAYRRFFSSRRAWMVSRPRYARGKASPAHWPVIKEKLLDGDVHPAERFDAWKSPSRKAGSGRWAFRR